MEANLRSDEKACPWCGATIPLEAPDCDYCGHVFTISEMYEARKVYPQPEEEPYRAIAPEAGEVSQPIQPSSFESPVIAQTEVNKSPNRVWGWLLVVIGAFLILLGICLESIILSITLKVPPSGGTAAYNFGYNLALRFFDLCIAPPELIAGIIVLIIGIRMLRKAS